MAEKSSLIFLHEVKIGALFQTINKRAGPHDATYLGFGLKTNAVEILHAYRFGSLANVVGLLPLKNLNIRSKNVHNL